jgi:hypothetical protein
MNLSASLLERVTHPPGGLVDRDHRVNTWRSFRTASEPTAGYLFKTEQRVL